MKLNKYKSIIENTSEEVKSEIRLSMDVLERIHELLDLKFGGKQKLLAEKMGKSESEISKLLSGVQNYTTRTLVKLSLAFDAPIIAVCTDNGQDSTFVEVKMACGITHSKLEISNDGQLEDTQTSYSDYKPTRLSK